jgi:hypothetical protein
MGEKPVGALPFFNIAPSHIKTIHGIVAYYTAQTKNNPSLLACEAKTARATLINLTLISIALCICSFHCANAALK